MKVRYESQDLERLEFDAKYNAGLGQDVVRGFRKVMNFIRQAANEHDFRNMRSLNFEKLKGDYEGSFSMRLNLQWRLIIRIEKEENGNLIVVVKIDDYH